MTIHVSKSSESYSRLRKQPTSNVVSYLSEHVTSRLSRRQASPKYFGACDKQQGSRGISRALSGCTWYELCLQTQTEACLKLSYLLKFLDAKQKLQRLWNFQVSFCAVLGVLCSMVLYGALIFSDVPWISLNGVFSSYDVWTAERCDSTFSHAPNDQGRNNLTTKVLLMFGAVSHRHTATRYLPYLKYGLWMVRCVIGAHLLKPPQTFSFTSLSSSRSLDHWAQ